MRNKITYITLAFCLLAYTYSSAQDLLKFTIKGKIANAVDSTFIQGATLLNLTNIDGVVSGKEGFFEIDVTESDTLLISSLGYESIKLKITKDLSKGTELNVDLFPRIEELPEVKVSSYKIIGVLEIDVKNVPKDRYNRIHINGLKQSYEVKNSKTGSSLGAGGVIINNPADFVYNLFGSKPRKLKDLKELKDKDATRKILTNRFDREVILDYLQMDLNKLTEVLSDCDYSPYFINKATDLQLIEAVLECYDNRRAVKNGNTSKEGK
ncbi:TonB-dependent receptor [Wenyingzhuangia fucanilytica]|uniref:TonB-dependent receptor n=1 Tax=Wenyingzhuangia fucanilytica TaxID=1790137 RepID=A0A1B1Y4A8_9FLAO|nr:TonB-dependent receptor [Wenyingzhuangia fucanilytica]ANW95614.1 TonB-dependent receptor [Wenyingzhuangia fucanilytica]